MGVIDKVVKQKRKGKIVALDEPIKPKGGKKIPGAFRKIMEQAFDTDFSQVRIHSDDESAALVEQIGADGFTQGEHIYLQAGGIRIDDLAYECSHVVQQREGKTLKGAKVMIAR